MENLFAIMNNREVVGRGRGREDETNKREQLGEKWNYLDERQNNLNATLFGFYK